MMNKLTLILIIFFNLFCYSQSIQNIIPPSPNAASLAQYADVPVSNYTGVPNISIPLFDVKSGKIDLPISLSYHASGIKVAQEASLVGLGWALNSGGVITRQVRGFNDFATPGGYISNTVPPSTVYNLPDNNYYPQNYNNYYIYLNSSDPLYKVDGEPDIFYYNFCGQSGELFFQQESPYGNKAVSVEQSNLKFSFFQDSWVVTDGNGYQYYFGNSGNSSLYANETTTNYDYTEQIPLSNSSYLLNSRNILSYDLQTETVDTAWYLTKIITPDGDKVDFIYEDNFYNNTLSSLSYSENRTNKLDPLKIYDDNAGYLVLSPYSFLNGEHLSSYSQQSVKDVYLKKIFFKNGYIEFNYSDREDLRISNLISFTKKAQKLESAELFDLENNSLKKIVFNYSYFNENILSTNPDHAADFLRLKLDSISEFYNERGTQEYKSIPSYLFTYNSISLPDKLSFSIDYWGYFNGKNNNNISVYDFQYKKRINNGIGINGINLFKNPQNLIRMLSPEYLGLNYGNLTYIRGADRSVDTTNVQAAILKKITYPTGGSREFSYKSNTYYDEDANYEKARIDVSAIDYSDYEVLPEQKEIVFTVNEPTLFFMNLEIYKSNYDLNNPSLFLGEAVLEHLNGGKVSFLSSNIDFDDWGRYNTHLSLALDPGSYRLYANNANDDFLDISINGFYYLKNENNKKNGGGVKVDAITTTDKNDVVDFKKYIYDDEDGNSSGKLISPLNCWYNEALINSISDLGLNEPLSYGIPSDSFVHTSYSVFPFGNSAQGQVIGYDKVSILHLNQGDNLGKSSYYYRNLKESPSGFFIPGIPNLKNLSNGQLLKEVHINSDGKIVNTKDYEYETSVDNRIGIKGVKRFDVDSFHENLPPTVCIRYYDVYSEWWHPESTTETIYDKDVTTLLPQLQIMSMKIHCIKT